MRALLESGHDACERLLPRLPYLVGLAPETKVTDSLPERVNAECHRLFFAPSTPICGHGSKPARQPKGIRCAGYSSSSYGATLTEDSTRPETRI